MSAEEVLNQTKLYHGTTTYVTLDDLFSGLIKAGYSYCEEQQTNERSMLSTYLIPIKNVAAVMEQICGTETFNLGSGCMWPEYSGDKIFTMRFSELDLIANPGLGCLPSEILTDKDLANDHDLIIPLLEQAERDYRYALQMGPNDYKLIGKHDSKDGAHDSLARDISKLVELSNSDLEISSDGLTVLVGSIPVCKLKASNWTKKVYEMATRKLEYCSEGDPEMGLTAVSRQANYDLENNRAIYRRRLKLV